MASAAQLQAAATSAIQAEATADLALIQGFLTTNGPSFVTLKANFATLAGALSSTARIAQANLIAAELAQCQADFLTLQSTTTAAQTTVPVA